MTIGALFRLIVTATKLVQCKCVDVPVRSLGVYLYRHIRSVHHSNLSTNARNVQLCSFSPCLWHSRTRKRIRYPLVLSQV